MKEVAKLRMEDLHKEQSLQLMQLKAQKEEKPIPHHNKTVRTSNVDERYLLKDETENDIRAKLDRIGYNSRITPEELAQKKVLSRPEQAEINAYNIRLKQLGKEANTNVATEVPPTLDVPESEENWVDLGERYELDSLLHKRDVRRQEIDHLRAEIQALDTQKGSNARAKHKTRAVQARDATFSASIKTAEGKLFNATIGLQKEESAIRNVRELRRLYTVAQKSRFKEEMDAYMTQVSTLTSCGLSTQRLPMESDQDYLQRMHDNVQDITLQEELFDGSLYLNREFMAKLRSLNITLETAEGLNKLISDDTEEWVISHWPKVSREFVKTFGTNPYQVKLRDVSDLKTTG
jgi:hypothetical protein